MQATKNFHLSFLIIFPIAYELIFGHKNVYLLVFKLFIRGVQVALQHILHFFLLGVLGNLNCVSKKLEK